MLSSLKYVKQYFRPESDTVEVSAATYTRDGQQLPATVYRPRARTRPGTAWIVLHGLTYHGPRHPGLQRFAGALCAAGHVVFIPEIPEWTRLMVAPQLTTPTIRGAADVVAARDDVDSSRVGVFGFSFGATHGIVSGGDAVTAERIRSIVAWGGYTNIGRLVHFGLTGEHELDGVREHMDPDPYGRWIFGGNYLTSIEGYEDMQRVADALMQLAREAGRSGVFAGDPFHDPLKHRLAARLNARERGVFDLFALTNTTHDMGAARILARALAATIVASDPLMDPEPRLDGVRVPILLAHGRDDRLIPYTETLRMQRRLNKNVIAGCTITSLFAHSGATESRLGKLGVGREAVRFLGMLNRILTRL